MSFGIGCARPDLPGIYTNVKSYVDWIEGNSVAPTTVVPTTMVHTTVAPTTVAPTIVVPTTIAPTTVNLTFAKTKMLPSYENLGL